MTVQDSTRTIGKSIKDFISGTLISRSTGLFREVAMASIFGTHPAVAAFWMAFRFAHLFRRLLGEGALHTVFVPQFESIRKQDPSQGARFFLDLSTLLTLILLGIVAFAEGILGSVQFFSNLSEGNREIIRLTMILMPALVFISLYALNSSLLNCERSYFLPSAAPACLNLIWILAIFLVWHFPIPQAIEYLAILIVFAFALQWLVTVPYVWRYFVLHLGKERREKGFSGKQMLAIAKPFALGILGVAATQLNTALDALFARTADPEGPAYLWYAIRIQQLPLALFGVGLTGALLPPIARAIQHEKKEAYLHFMHFAVKRTFILMIPLTAALFALGFSGINLVYGHGEFSTKAISQTTLCLWAYGLGLLPMTLVLVFASAFYAHKNYRTTTVLAILAVILNVILNAVFVFVCHLGAVSIALATSLSATINSVLLAHYLKKDNLLDLTNLLLPSLKILVASVSAMLLTWMVGSFWADQQTLFPRELLGQLIAFGSQALSFLIFFLAAAYLLRIEEVFSLLTIGNKKFNK